MKELDKIRAGITSVLGDSLCNIDISGTTISKCVLKLKAGKRDGGHGFDSDNLINGSNKLFPMIRFLFNAMIVHGYSANDKVHYGKLFKLLIVRGMPGHIIKLLLDSYARQQLRVSWDSCISRFFDVSNGVNKVVLSRQNYLLYISMN